MGGAEDALHHHCILVPQAAVHVEQLPWSGPVPSMQHSLILQAAVLVLVPGAAVEARAAEAAVPVAAQVGRLLLPANAHSMEPSLILQGCGFAVEWGGAPQHLNT